MECRIPIVIDSGSAEVKAGFAGDNSPQCVFPSIIAKPLQLGNMFGRRQRDVYYVGDSALRMGNIEYPIEHGVVTDWDSVERIWYHTLYKELDVEPEEHPVLLTDTVLCPRKDRERIAQVMFETFNTPAVYISNKQALSLYSAGITTGLVVDSGSNSTHTVPIHKGHVLDNSVSRVCVGGKQLTNYLANLLSMKYSTRSYHNDRSRIEDEKSKFAFVRKELQKATNLRTAIHFTDVYSVCVEPMFQPSLIESEEKGVHEIINDSILKSDPHIHKHLYSNILLTGGNTMFPGLPERLHTELSHLAPQITDVNIVATPDRKYSAWVGGSMLASMNWFEKIWISKMEYNENGPEIVHRKCF